MDLMVFKVTFQAEKEGVAKLVIKTITYCSDPTVDQYGKFDLQKAIDRLIAQMKSEGYVRIELRDVQNISTPIIRKKF